MGKAKERKVGTEASGSILKAIKARRSVRKYKPKEVPKEIILKLIDAARYAPSAHNSQPWHFIVVTEKNKKEALSRTHQYSRFLSKAPVIFVALADERKSPEHFVEDCSASIQNLLIAASSLGLGACWVAVYSKSTIDKEEYVKSILEIPNQYRVIAMIGVGYPAERPFPKRVKDFSEFVHWEKF